MTSGSLWPSPNGTESEGNSWIILAESEWSGRIRMAESYALVAAVRNLAYHRHHLVLGASDALAHAWLG